MVQIKAVVRGFALLLLVGLLAMASGCGGGSDGSSTPPVGRSGEDQQKARTEAYGKGRTLSATSTGQNAPSKQAEARRQAGR